MRDEYDFRQIRAMAREAAAKTRSTGALSTSVIEAIATASLAAIEYWLEPGSDKADLIRSAANLIEQSSVDCEGGAAASAGSEIPDSVARALMNDDELALDVVILGPLSEDDGGQREFPSLRAWSDSCGKEDVRLALAAYRAGAGAVDRPTFTALAWLTASGLHALADDLNLEGR